jgi:hypothetical protein
MPHRVPMFLALAAALLLGGCKFDLAAMNGNCKKLSDKELRVGRDQACKFNFHGGDYAKYVVVIQRAPMHGEAKGEGKYLRYVPRKGFVGEDRVTIRIERRLAHLQWETRTVTIKVGPSA